MTAYYETRDAAHVMLYDGEQWEPRCQFNVSVKPRDYRDSGDEWPVHHVWTIYGGSGKAPTKPWCKHCVRRVQLDVDEMVGSVLLNRGGRRDG